MNEQYLWDRTGNDPEIKRLEEALAGFRYQEIAPPVLPVTTAAAITGTKLSWRFSLPLAFAAVAVAIAVGGIWLLVGGWNTGVSEEISVVETSNAAAASKPIADPTFPNEVVQAPEKVKQAGKPRVILSDHRRHKQTARAVMTKHTVALTPEEKDAYNRLLLALSITGSKLKIVSDTINRTDEDKTGRDPNNR